MCQHIDKCVTSITEYVTMIEHSLQHPLYPDLLCQLQNMMSWDGLEHDHINPGYSALPMLGAPRSAVVARRESKLLETTNQPLETPKAQG